METKVQIDNRIDNIGWENGYAAQSTDWAGAINKIDRDGDRGYNQTKKCYKNRNE